VRRHENYQIGKASLNKPSNANLTPGGHKLIIARQILLLLLPHQRTDTVKFTPDFSLLTSICTPFPPRSTGCCPEQFICGRKYVALLQIYEPSRILHRVATNALRVTSFISRKSEEQSNIRARTVSPRVNTHYYDSTVVVKVKISVHGMRALKMRGGIAPHILNLSIRWS
jgi:hypothetical protein